MECDDNAEVADCVHNMNHNKQDVAIERNKDQASWMDSRFLTASDLLSVRGIVCKYKNRDDESLEVSKAPKMYYPNECTVSEEIIDGIMEDNRKSLELQRAAKSRDCVKAEWNDELKVAVVPYLKGKCSQHVGVNVKGSCALSPQEALFLLEKSSIEIERNNVSLSVEEAHAVMLQGKLSVEKYEVYSFLSQQGFIVVHHQSRIGPSYEQLINLEKKKQRKRKAADGLVESPEQKRLTFTGVLASNSEISSVNVESSTLSNDNVLSAGESLSKVQSMSQDTIISGQNIADNLQNSEKLNANVSLTISPDSTNRIESNDSVEKCASASGLVQVNENVSVKTLNNDLVNSSKDNENIKAISNENLLSDKQNQNGTDFEEMVIENTNDEVDVENADDEDTNEVIIEDVQKLK